MSDLRMQTYTKTRHTLDVSAEELGTILRALRCAVVATLNEGTGEEYQTMYDMLWKAREDSTSAEGPSQNGGETK